MSVLVIFDIGITKTGLDSRYVTPLQQSGIRTSLNYKHSLEMQTVEQFRNADGRTPELVNALIHHVCFEAQLIESHR